MRRDSAIESSHAHGTVASGHGHHPGRWWGELVGTGRRLRIVRSLRYMVAIVIFGIGIATVAQYVTHGGDFQSIIWYPGRALFDGRDPYNTASFQHYYQANGLFPSYGPIHLWLAVIFAVLPFKVATAIWFIVNLAGLTVLAWVITRAIDRRLGLPAVIAVTGLLILSRPGRAILFAGQVSVLYTLLCYVAWSQVRIRPWVAAVALGLALGKPPFGFPLLALLLLQRAWPVVRRGLGIFVLGSLPIVVWLSVNDGSPVVLWHNIINNMRYTDRSFSGRPGAPRRIDAASVVARYVHVHVGLIAEIGCFVFVVALAGLLLYTASTKPGWPLSPDVLMVLGTVTLLAISHQDYDLVLMAWPFAVALRSLGHAVAVRRRRSASASDTPIVGPVPPGGATWRLAMPVLALPALVASIIPARDTLRLLDLGTDVGSMSTLTTGCLVLALVGGAIAVVFHHPQEDAVECACAIRPGTAAPFAYGPSVSSGFAARRGASEE